MVWNWLHDALYHEADQFRNGHPQTMFAFSDFGRPRVLSFAEQYNGKRLTTNLLAPGVIIRINQSALWSFSLYSNTTSTYVMVFLVPCFWVCGIPDAKLGMLNSTLHANIWLLWDKGNWRVETPCNSTISISGTIHVFTSYFLLFHVGYEMSNPQYCFVVVRYQSILLRSARITSLALG